jgi:hypothetical protein
VAIGERLVRFGGADNPDVARYLGLAYNLAGSHQAAVAYLERALRRVEAVDRWSVVQALADSYLALNRRDDARRVLTGVLADPAVTEPARRMLVTNGLAAG